jgi:hypothetical protein
MHDQAGAVFQGRDVPGSGRARWEEFSSPGRLNGFGSWTFTSTISSARAKPFAEMAKKVANARATCLLRR